MATNFPEIWSDRFIKNLNTATVAPWLDGIPELNAQVSEINGGSLSEQNTIHVAATDFDVEVLVNNSSYPIDLQTYTDDTLSFNLDKFQTKVVSLNDDDVIGASYDKIDVVTRTMKEGILAKKFKKAIHALAPAEHKPKTPVLKTTGGPNKLKDGTRLRLTYEDLVAFKNACKGFGVKRLVLSETHFNDLLLDRKNFGDKLVNYNAGELAPVIAGFKIYQWDDENMPNYGADNKRKAFGAAAEGTDQLASVAFGETGVAKKTGLTKQYYSPAATNPRGQTNDLAYRHYFMAVPFRAEKVAAILSGVDGEPTSVNVLPGSKTTAQSTTTEFSALVLPLGVAQDVNWTIDVAAELSVDATGKVTVGATTPTGDYTVTATADGYPGIAGTATLTVE